MRWFRQPWVLFTACVVILFAAMGWLSIMLMQLDQSSAVARRRAMLEETVRLALWRMDSRLAALIATENARPAYEYEAFFPVGSTYTRLFTQISPGDVLMPSPLLVSPPDGIRLHFQFDAAGKISSPQVPEGNMRDLAEVSYVSYEAIVSRSVDLAEARGLVSMDGLRREIDQSARMEPVRPGVPEMKDKKESESLQIAAIPQNQDVLQSMLNTQEYEARRKHYTKSAPAMALPPVSRAPAPMEELAFADTDDGSGTFDVESAVGQLEKGGTTQSGSMAEPSEMERPEMERPVMEPAEMKLSAMEPAEMEFAAMKPSVTEPARGEPMFQAGQFHSVWIARELFSVRKAFVNGNERLQGFWMDWPVVEKMLLDDIRDLLPNARLEPESGADNGAIGMRRLASIPLRLNPGAFQGPVTVGWSPVRLSLVVAWLCVLIAVISAATLLHGVVALSERRAAFVSAVTHELRTPLTTFRMYTEMLTEGMVPDPEGQREYLKTLHTESERLGHLVENVLLFARLEKSSADYHSESVNLKTLLETVTPRLRERAAQAGMTLAQTPLSSDGAGGGNVQADLPAVERILFNLVDNAGKYAAAADDKRIVIEVIESDRTVEIAVRDFGPGIGEAMRKKLFSAFSKSARDAAGTAPGVGLGLALSRRLARKMGGDLRFDPTIAEGTRFILRLRR